ncbi:MAG: hypothetical protein U7126_32370 [Microcoleus sp.]
MLVLIAVGCVRFEILNQQEKSGSDAPFFVCVSCEIVGLDRK